MSRTTCFVALLRDDQHALLRFAQQDLVRRHARSRASALCEIDLDAGAAAAGRFAGRAGQPRRAHVLDAGDRIGREQFEARFEQQLFLERIADLHRRPVFARFLGQIARGKRRARQAVAPRLRADVKDRIADALRRAARELLVPQNAEAKDVHQRIAFEAFVEINLAADGRDADAIAVMRDAGDHAGEKPAIRLHVRGSIAGDRAEAQRVQQEHRPRAHGENIADDSAHAGGRALERLDRARVIVRLSILNAIAQPSPISITPAFSSPAFTRMFGPVVGNFFSSRREFL